jgi:hypothetical protein
VRYEVKQIERKTRTYPSILKLASNVASLWNTIRVQSVLYAKDGPEKLSEVFLVMDVSEQDYGLRLIIQQNDTLVTYLMWMSLPFYQDSMGLNVGSKVNVIGWQTSNRITNFRKFFKVRAI